MNAEELKTKFDWSAVILLLLTFLTGLGALITGNIINERQAAQLLQFDKAVLLQPAAQHRGFQSDRSWFRRRSLRTALVIHPIASAFPVNSFASRYMYIFKHANESLIPRTQFKMGSRHAMETTYKFHNVQGAARQGGAVGQPPANAGGGLIGDLQSLIRQGGA